MSYPGQTIYDDESDSETEYDDYQLPQNPSFGVTSAAIQAHNASTNTLNLTQLPASFNHNQQQLQQQQLQQQQQQQQQQEYEEQLHLQRMYEAQQQQTTGSSTFRSMLSTLAGTPMASTPSIHSNHIIHNQAPSVARSRASQTARQMAAHRAAMMQKQTSLTNSLYYQQEQARQQEQAQPGWATQNQIQRYLHGETQEEAHLYENRWANSGFFVSRDLQAGRATILQPASGIRSVSILEDGRSVGSLGSYESGGSSETTSSLASEDSAHLGHAILPGTVNSSWDPTASSLRGSKSSTQHPTNKTKSKKEKKKMSKKERARANAARIAHIKKARAKQEKVKNGGIVVYDPIFFKSLLALQFCLVLASIWINDGVEPITTNPWLGPSTTTMVGIGAKYTQGMRKGQLWRYLTPPFLHVGFLHFLTNASFIRNVCLRLEQHFGPYRIAAVYFLSGYGGTISSAIFLPNQVQTSSTAALFGIQAILFVDLWQNWKLLQSPKRHLIELAVTTGIALLAGLLPTVDNFGHLGGFLTGILAGFVFVPSLNLGHWRARFKQLLILVAAPSMIALLVTATIVFTTAIPASGWCSWCSSFTCYEAFDWDCSDFVETVDQ